MDSSSERDQRLRADLQSLRIERSPGQSQVPRARRGRGSRGLRIAAGVAVLLVVGLGVRLVRGSVVPVELGQATAVEAGTLAPAPVLSGSGYVVTGDRYVSIGVRVAGRIDRYFIEEGQSVRKGDPLVQLDDRDYRSAVARIEAGLALARANTELADAELRRGRALRKSGVISDQEIDLLENRVRVAHASVAQLAAELDAARVNLEYTTLRAPTDGVVLAKLKEVGEIAVPGGFAGSGDLVRIANLSDMRAEVDVNEADLGRVHMGGAALVTPDAYSERQYAARVVKLYPQVDRQKGTLKVEVQILEPDDALLPDMSARVTFLADAPAAGAVDAPRAVLVPARALQRDNDGSFVWIVEKGRVRRAQVETSGEAGDRVRVVSGLTGGETVVVGEVTLQEGQRVTETTAG